RWAMPTTTPGLTPIPLRMTSRSHGSMADGHLGRLEPEASARFLAERGRSRRWAHPARVFPSLRDSAFTAQGGESTSWEVPSDEKPNIEGECVGDATTLTCNPCTIPCTGGLIRRSARHSP